MRTYKHNHTEVIPGLSTKINYLFSDILKYPVPGVQLEYMHMKSQVERKEVSGTFIVTFTVQQFGIYTTKKGRCVWNVKLFLFS